MFNLTKFLKGLYPRFRWDNRIKKYIANTGGEGLSPTDAGDYMSSPTSALAFINTVERDEVRMNLIIKVQEFQIKVLDTKLAGSDAVKVKHISLESQHFNIYGVKNMEELGLKIAGVINDGKIEATETLTVDNTKGCRVFNEFIYAIAYKYSFNSTKTNLVTIRNELKKHITDPKKLEIALNEFKFSNIIYNVMNNKTANIKEKNINDVLPPINVAELEKFMAVALTYLDVEVKKKNRREVFTHLSVAVTLATGLRLTDWFTQSDITKVADFKIHAVGLGKKRKGSKVEEKTIPTLLLPADTIIKMVLKLRRMIRAGTRNKIAKEKEAHQLTDFDIIPSTMWVKGDKFSFLRGIYVVACERIYNQLHVDESLIVPQLTYFIKLLGHEKGSDTYQHYMKVKVLLKGFDLEAYKTKSISAMM